MRGSSEVTTAQFGQRIRQLRLARGWELEYTAQGIGCTAEVLDQYERGMLNGLTPETIAAFADQLEADVDELFVLAGRLPPCLAWVQRDPTVAKLLGTLVALIDSRVTLPARPGGLPPTV